MPEPSESNGLLTEGVRQLWALRSSPLYVMTEALDRSPIHPKRMMETIRTAVPKHLFTIANYLLDKFRKAREFRPTCQGFARVENLPESVGSGANFIKCMFLSGEKALQILS